MRALLLCFLLPLLAGSAFAQDLNLDPLARTRFIEGRAAYEQHDYARAYADFQLSYDLSQRPELLYNVGLAALKLGKAPEALDAFEGYLAWGKGEREDEVRGRVAALRDLVEREPAPKAAEPVPTPAAVARAAHRPEPAHAPPPPVREESRRSSKGWWIAAGVILAAAAIAVGVAVPLSKHDKTVDPRPNTGLKINALRLP